MREAETSTDNSAIAKQGSHIFGASVRCDVEVFGVAAEEEIANAAADEVSLEAATLKSADDTGGIGVDAALIKRNIVTDKAGVEVTVVRANACRDVTALGGFGKRVPPIRRGLAPFVRERYVVGFNSKRGELGRLGKF